MMVHLWEVQTTSASEGKGPPLSGSQKPNPVISNNKSSSSGKLAFSLKQKSKLVAPAVKLSEDEEDDESNGVVGDLPLKRQKLEQPYVSDQSLKQVYVGNCFLLLITYFPLYFLRSSFCCFSKISSSEIVICIPHVGGGVNC